MAFGRYTNSPQIAGTVMGSWLNAAYPSQTLASVIPVYSGTSGSVFLLIER